MAVITTYLVVLNGAWVLFDRCLVISGYVGSVHMHYFALMELASPTVKQDTSYNDICLHKL